MHIERIGFTPVKGGRHLTHDAVDLAAGGPVGDRAFCLVDRARGRVVRTVENPALLRTRAQWADGMLSVQVPGSSGAVGGRPEPTGELLKLDYWGRQAAVEVCEGPWAEAYSGFLGFEVSLARARQAGEVVYAGSVSLVTTSSLQLLADRIGRSVGGARFRPTFVVDTGDADPHVEDTWVGREVRLGDAAVLVRGLLPRCAVVDLAPESGRRDAPVLRGLGGYRRRQGVIAFGVDAVVVAPGCVRTGDHAEPGRG